MSFVSSNDHPNANNPQDPLYYAPRSVRSQADPRIPQTRPEELPVPRCPHGSVRLPLISARPSQSQARPMRNHRATL